MVSGMAYRYPQAVLIIFCKAPIAGSVKTRLLPALNPQQAAEVHEELTTRLLEWTTASRLCPVQLWCTPNTSHPFFAQVATRYGLSLHLQHGEDLGERMFYALQTGLRGYALALLIGCDCPSLDVIDLEQAINALSTNDIVLAPAEDGGYVLIGAARNIGRSLFTGIRWGSAEVYAETVKHLQQSNSRYHELATQWDVDTPQDLLRYRTLPKLSGQNHD